MTNGLMDHFDLHPLKRIKGGHILAQKYAVDPPPLSILPGNAIHPSISPSRLLFFVRSFPSCAISQVSAGGEEEGKKCEEKRGQNFSSEPPGPFYWSISAIS